MAQERQILCTVSLMHTAVVLVESTMSGIRARGPILDAGAVLTSLGTGL